MPSAWSTGPTIPSGICRRGAKGERNAPPAPGAPSPLNPLPRDAGEGPCRPRLIRGSVPLAAAALRPADGVGEEAPDQGDGGGRPRGGSGTRVEDSVDLG